MSLAADVAPDVFTQLVQYGLAGIVLALLITGMIVPRYILEQIKADRDEWRAALRDEQAAHKATREAAVEANARAEAAVEAAKTTALMLRELGHRPVPRVGE